MKISYSQLKNIQDLYPGIKPDDNVIFLGVDTRETMAYLIAKHSIEKRSPRVKVLPLYTKALRQAGIYWRPMLTEGNTGQYVDVMENRPHSVDFSFTRFLVPIIAKALGINGYVMFADCDFLFLTDLNKLFLELNGSYSNRPVAVVKHEFPTYTENKMDGCKQLSYTKKLWSAFMCFNTNHPDLEFLTIGNINKVDGMWLHGFKWLPDESAIVGLPEYYQYIPDHSEKNIDAPPRIIHYTEKAPWFNGPNRSCGWSDFWWDEVAEWKKAVASTGRNERFWE